MLLQEYRKQVEVMCWLNFQMGGIGPMQLSISATSLIVFDNLPDMLCISIPILNSWLQCCRVRPTTS